MTVRLLRSCLFLLVASMMFVPVFLEAQAKADKADKEEEDPAKTEAFFQAKIKTYYDDWNTLNLDKAGVYYAKDPDLVFYDIMPLKYTGWEAYKAGVKKLLEGFTSFRLIPQNDLKISRRGKVVWTTIGCHFSGVLKDGTKSELEARHTAIWEKRGKGDWLIVHEHVSVALPDAPANAPK